MRNVYIKFENLSNFKTRTFEDHLVIYGAIVNGSGQQLILDRPKLCRKIVGGVLIKDHWGDNNKWFQDHVATLQPLWG